MWSSSKPMAAQRVPLAGGWRWRTPRRPGAGPAAPRPCRRRRSPAWISTDSPGCSRGQVDQPVVGGEEDDRHGGRLGEAPAVGDRARRAGGRSTATGRSRRRTGPSPGRRRRRPVTPGPTSSTTPAPSLPSGALAGYMPRAISTSRKFRPAARTDADLSAPSGSVRAREGSERQVLEGALAHRRQAPRRRGRRIGVGGRARASRGASSGAVAHRDLRLVRSRPRRPPRRRALAVEVDQHEPARVLGLRRAHQAPQPAAAARLGRPRRPTATARRVTTPTSRESSVAAGQPPCSSARARPCALRRGVATARGRRRPRARSTVAGAGRVDPAIGVACSAARSAKRSAVASAADVAESPAPARGHGPRRHPFEPVQRRRPAAAAASAAPGSTGAAPASRPTATGCAVSVGDVHARRCPGRCGAAGRAARSPRGVQAHAVPGERQRPPSIRRPVEQAGACSAASSSAGCRPNRVGVGVLVGAAPPRRTPRRRGARRPQALERRAVP